MVQESSFILDREGVYMCLDTARIITGQNLDLLLTIMNSKLFFYSVKTFYGGGGLGETGVRMKHTFFENFPTPIFTQEAIKSFKIFALNSDPEVLHIIDRLIFSLYNLSEDEIRFIESQ